jgi:hypothetical protein
MQRDARRGRSVQPWCTKVGAQPIGGINLVGLIGEWRAVAWLKAHQRDAVAAQLRESAQQFGAQRCGLLRVRRNNDRAARRVGDPAESGRESLDQELRTRPCSTVVCNQSN